MIEILEAASESDIESIRALFREYAAGLGVDLCFQNFEGELASLPGGYAAPRGRLYLALDGERPVGCAALRPLAEDTCELKRVYVRPEGRGTGLGRRLVDRALGDAVVIGYRRVCLDTLPGMEAAQELYRSLGFRETRPYTYNPIAGTLFMEKTLEEAAT